MTDPIWDTSHFEGCARTQYVLDASLFSPGAAPFGVNTGTGSATVTAGQDGRPRFNLQIGRGAGTSSLVFTPRIFTSDAVAVLLDIENFGMSRVDTTDRPSLNARFSLGAEGYGVKGDLSSTRLWSKAGNGAERSSRILGGNIFPVLDTQVGFFADYQKMNLLGHMGYAITQLPRVPESNSAFQFAIENTGSKENTLYFTKATATVIWKRVGTETVAHVKP